MKKVVRSSNETLPKAQRTRGLSSAYQSNFTLVTLGHITNYYTNLDQTFRISTKHQIQNLNQTSAFQHNLNPDKT